MSWDEIDREIDRLAALVRATPIAPRRDFDPEEVDKAFVNYWMARFWRARVNAIKPRA